MTKRIILAGGSGFLGRALAREFGRGGAYEVVTLTRAPRAVGDVHWDGHTVGRWAAVVDGADAVVNLAGRSVNCRYTARNLAEIDESRVNAVRAIGAAIRAAARPPPVLVQASTTAIYGDAGDRWCDEATPPGDGIPPRTATKWERAFADSPTPQTRRVLLRISFAIGPGGGVLSMLATLARCFLGGTVGTGRQYVSWVHADDVARFCRHAVEDGRVTGVYNVATPNPVTNAALMRELRRVLGRPWSPPAPAWAVRVGCALLRTEPVLALTGRRANVDRLLATGFQFRYPELAPALRAALSRS